MGFLNDIGKARYKYLEVVRSGGELCAVFNAKGSLTDVKAKRVLSEEEIHSLAVNQQDNITAKGLSQLRIGLTEVQIRKRQEGIAVDVIDP